VTINAVRCFCYSFYVLTLNLLATTTVGARINPWATNVIYIYDISSLRVNTIYIYEYIYIYIYDISSLRVNDLTLILLTWRKW